MSKMTYERVGDKLWPAPKVDKVDALYQVVAETKVGLICAYNQLDPKAHLDMEHIFLIRYNMIQTSEVKEL